jgi:FtsZ-interacting cell division protein ZipA
MSANEKLELKKDKFKSNSNPLDEILEVKPNIVKEEPAAPVVEAAPVVAKTLDNGINIFTIILVVIIIVLIAVIVWILWKKPDTNSTLLTQMRNDNNKLLRENNALKIKNDSLLVEKSDLANDNEGMKKTLANHNINYISKSNVMQFNEDVKEGQEALMEKPPKYKEQKKQLYKVASDPNAGQEEQQQEQQPKEQAKQQSKEQPAKKADEQPKEEDEEYSLEVTQ